MHTFRQQQTFAVMGLLLIVGCSVLHWMPVAKHTAADMADKAIARATDLLTAWMVGSRDPSPPSIAFEVSCRSCQTLCAQQDSSCQLCRLTLCSWPHAELLPTTMSCTCVTAPLQWKWRSCSGKGQACCAHLFWLGASCSPSYLTAEHLLCAGGAGQAHHHASVQGISRPPDAPSP